MKFPNLLWALLALSLLISGCASVVEQQQALDDRLTEFQRLPTKTDAQRLQMKQELAAARHRSPWANLVLASFYDSDSASPEEQEKLLPLYELAIKDKPYPKAVARLAYLHLEGELPHADSAKGYHYLRMAANLNNEWAQLKMVDLWVLGEPSINLPALPKVASLYLPEDHLDVQAWHCLNTYAYRLSKTCVEAFVDAEKEGELSPYGAIGLGLAYAHGWTVAKDLKQAERLFRRVTQRGVTEADVHLAELYLSSDSKAQQAQGEALLKNASSELPAWRAYAETLLAEHYYQQGRYDDALEIALNTEPSAEINYQLYQHYLLGRGTDKDRQQANHYLQLAAYSGHPQGMYDLYLDAPLEPSERVRLMRMSATQGCVDAMVWMAQHSQNRGDSEAQRLWQKEAAIGGHVPSQLAVAQSLALDPQQRKYAYPWYQRAAQQGSQPAQSWLKHNSVNAPKRKSGRLLQDGSFILPEHHVLLPEGNDIYLQGNIDKVWPTHCGWVIQRKFGDAAVVVNEQKRNCIPSDLELMQLMDNGAVEVVHNHGATAALLGNGQLISWGSRLMGGYLIEEANWHDEQAADWPSLLKIYHHLQRGVVTISATESALQALTNDGEIWQWGRNGVAYQVPGEYRQLIGGHTTVDACGVTTQGGLNCWGEFAPTQITQVVDSGVKVAASVPYMSGGYGFGLLALFEGEQQGQLGAWNVYYGDIKRDQQLMAKSELRGHHWRSLKAEPADSLSLFAERDDGVKIRFYYPGRYLTGSYRIESN
ncbi:SEL1-like repeat protein [Ferrimonas aestuarii]|uniref:Sel1 repeat family protein n=1 Tax=Ferrimonas aestuarii TaxID=2569539 RepID=A0A4V5NW53_9GAMM|nr:SEL1-like repeat protein [Ferrimonas aestuarii]TKB55034.1 hypothetical protein FCL42_10760 [Ferrimonas aestuarii]